MVIHRYTRGHKVMVGHRDTRGHKVIVGRKEIMWHKVLTGHRVIADHKVITDHVVGHMTGTKLCKPHSQCTEIRVRTIPQGLADIVARQPLTPLSPALHPM